ncbi:MAG TPA: methyltransferase [Streptosporangiaceae bacterium]|nr:methyltransferase [Streptosporangiaceae bacterium]
MIDAWPADSVSDLSDSAVPAVPAVRRLERLMDGYVTTQLLYVAAKLGIADVLADADGPQTGPAIAARVGADPDLLTRVLRGLVLEGVLAEHPNGGFVLTGLGSCLRATAPDSMRGPIIARGEVYYSAAGGLLRTVVDGGTAFQHVYGERFFDHLASHPEHDAAFHASMAGRAQQEADAVVATYDFGKLNRLVDVGGGRGVLTAAILRAAPGLHAELLDRPTAIEDARRYLAAHGLADRCSCIAGDFFDAVPAGADAYLLSRIIHDWNDDDARQILATVRAAMPPAGRVLLAEAILPERVSDQPGAIRMDLNMLILFGTKERTAAQYRDLLAQAGLRIRQILPTPSPAGLSVIEATIA